MAGLNITARQWRDLLAPVIPLAATNDLPVLNAVHITAEGKWLLAEATDRFVVGIHRMEGEWPRAWEAIVPLPTVKAIQSTFRPSRGENPRLTLTISKDGHSLAVECAGGLLDMAEARISYPLLVADYPKLRALVGKHRGRAASPREVRLNARHLARFAAADEGDGLTFNVGATDKTPTTVTGWNFVGAIMPRSLVSGGTAPTTWGPILGAPDADASAEEAVA